MYIDFQKAFDKVNHIMLIEKMVHLGFAEGVVKLCLLSTRQNAVLGVQRF